MTKKQYQITNLKLSKKLKELGVPQVSLWYWSRLDENDIWKILDNGSIQPQLNFERYSAFTVAELGEMLPCEIYVENWKDWAVLEMGKKSENEWWIGYAGLNAEYTRETQKFKKFINNKSMVNLMAEMLIYLLENNLK